jgi:methanethiol S-methyltransferase
MKYLLIILIWSAYCWLHSYLISIRFTNLMIRIFKNYYSFYRLFYILISFILLVLIINFTEELDNYVIINYEFPWTIVRYIFLSGSLLMFFWSFFIDYDSLTFFGIRQILNFGKIKDKNTSVELKKQGLLGIIRHPMYLALIIFLCFQTFTLANIFVNIVLIIYVLIGTYLEEKKLVLEFGDVYIKYQQEVPMLIPFTKKRN